MADEPGAAPEKVLRWTIGMAAPELTQEQYQQAHAELDALVVARDGAVAALRYVLDQTVDSWHDALTPQGKPDPLLFEWLGLTLDEYTAYVECRWADLAASIAARETLTRVTDQEGLDV